MGGCPRALRYFRPYPVDTLLGPPPPRPSSSTHEVSRDITARAGPYNNKIGIARAMVHGPIPIRLTTSYSLTQPAYA